jgi:peptidoglycan/LPS O-acetylase OafA/YrhL
MAHPIGEQRGFRSQASPASAAEASRADRFRPDLEGLRAVAVILVLLYHARVPGFGGGYVGVDVFFVLSGYLITGLIVRELRETGSLSLEAFYARRARRLLPAAALVLLVTLVATAILTPSFFAQSVAADGLAAALYASNVRFALQATDYLAAAELDPSPLLHYWSLGVEEQFYLLWPTLSPLC